ncbi:serine/threonine-protein kinase Doa-like [Bradysia coprophila]|uniref:serine/threonine-protein kinase Doa-like n=1 Tax=Bradysia coprophila TaxID=38358 RepID=UPI00187D7CE9|nr:serine/threonine-protein kinase Doa-like [Bradysia coprophila]
MSENPAKRVKLEHKFAEVKQEIRVDEADYVVCNPGELIGPYRIDKKVGEGSFGRVLLATETTSGKCAALKLIKNDETKSKVAMTEIDALAFISRMDPQNKSLCIKMLENFISDSYVCIVFPVLGQSIFDFIRANNFESFPIDQTCHIAHQLCKAVDFLHRHGMTHTDLKPENILFVNSDYTTVYDSEKNCSVRRLNCTDIRLIDFGLLTRDKGPHSTIVSTRYYRAPEVILELGWSHPCDVWSIGCIMVEIYFGHVLFDTEYDREHLAIMEKTLGSIPLSMINATKTNHFKNGLLDWIWNGWEGMEEQIAIFFKPLEGYMLSDSDEDVSLFELIEKMLAYEPTKRISVSDALEHPFFNTLQS